MRDYEQGSAGVRATVSMETLKDILWPIVAIGGLGAFIDFLIGRTGQETAKDFLFRWWVRFDDVRWRNFGREEGLFAGRLIERWFGRKIYSIRRIAAMLLICAALLLIGYLAHRTAFEDGFFCLYCQYEPLTLTLTIFTFLVGFSISVSITLKITYKIAYLYGTNELNNLIMFCVMLTFNYVLLVIWNPLMLIIKDSFVAAFLFFPHPGELYPYLNHAKYVWRQTITEIWTLFKSVNIFPEKIVDMFVYPIKWKYVYIDSFVLSALTCIPSLFRFAASTIFVGSFLLKPLVMRPISLVWARIVESDKPIFTVIFGGAAAFATAISEAAKHL